MSQTESCTGVYLVIPIRDAKQISFEKLTRFLFQRTEKKRMISQILPRAGKSFFLRSIVHYSLYCNSSKLPRAGRIPDLFVSFRVERGQGE